jgi:hypothetical protein
MATQTSEKIMETAAQTTSSAPGDSLVGSDFTGDSDSSAERQPHPLASVLGSFRDDLDMLDAIMAGVEKYRQRMEQDEQIP